MIGGILFIPPLASLPMIVTLKRVQNLDYASAFRYVSAWASFDHDDVTDLTRSPHDFYGHLGSLDLLYSETGHTLYAFPFVGAGMGLLLTSRAEVKATLDQTARERPTETANGIFDIRTLPWNRRVTPKLEPCLYLRMDIGDATVLVPDMVKRQRSLNRWVHLAGAEVTACIRSFLNGLSWAC